MIENTKLKKFSLNSTAKKTFELNKLKNNLIIFIYPKDNTPGCTLESLDFKKNIVNLKNIKQILSVFQKIVLKVTKNFKINIISHLSFCLMKILKLSKC